MFSAGLITGLTFLSSLSIQSNICNLPVKPVITNPVDGSTISSNQVIIQGTALADSTVILGNNGTTIATVVADQNDSFAVQAVLADTTNVLSAKATTSCGSATGDNVTVTVSPSSPNPVTVGDSNSGVGVSTLGSSLPHVYTTGAQIGDSNPSEPTSGSDLIANSSSLKINIVAPTDNSTLKKNSTFVTGSISNLAKIRITVNGRQVVDIEQLSTVFNVSVPLDKGKNVIVIQAYTSEGQTNQVLTVTYAPNTAWYETLLGRLLIGIIIILGILIILWLVRSRK